MREEAHGVPGGEPAQMGLQALLGVSILSVIHGALSYGAQAREIVDLVADLSSPSGTRLEFAEFADRIGAVQILRLRLGRHPPELY